MADSKFPVAYRKAIMNLAGMPSGVAATALTKFILDERCFYKVRMLAIEMLPRVCRLLARLVESLLIALCFIQMLVTTETGEKLGIYHLSKVFLSRYCRSGGEEGAVRLEPPQQDSVAEYLVSQVCTHMT